MTMIMRRDQIFYARVAFVHHADHQKQRPAATQGLVKPVVAAIRDIVCGKKIVLLFDFVGACLNKHPTQGNADDAECTEHINGRKPSPADCPDGAFE